MFDLIGNKKYWRNPFISFLFLIFSTQLSHGFPPVEKIDKITIQKHKTFKENKNIVIRWHNIFKPWRQTERNYQEEFLNSIPSLPEEIKSRKELVVNCDDNGRIWGINSGPLNVLFDQKTNKVL